MKIYRLFLLTLSGIIIISCSERKPLKYSQTVHKVSNLRMPHKILAIDHNYGARIVSLKYYGRELLLPYTANEDNFGSTFWTSPQSDWQWPPIATFDVMPYSMNMINSEIQYYSKADKKTGLQVGKYFKIDQTDSSFIITYIIKNISDKDKSVAPWEVTRRFAGGITFFPAGPDSAVMKKSTLPGVTHKDGIVWFEYDPLKIKADSKLFAMANEGWLANVRDSILFLKMFPDITGQVPPGQGEIEIFADKDKKYIELENHGEYVSLFPGDSLTYTMNWILKTIPGNLDKSAGSQELASWVRNVVFKKRFGVKRKLMKFSPGTDH